jgi:hypothetical protein
MDGEIVAMNQDIAIRIHPEELKVLAPPGNAWQSKKTRAHSSVMRMVPTGERAVYRELWRRFE